jgi:hypothetical protein
MHGVPRLIKFSCLEEVICSYILGVLANKSIYIHCTYRISKIDTHRSETSKNIQSKVFIVRTEEEK